MLGLIWVLTVCKGYQQSTSWEIVFSFFASSNLSSADKLCKQSGHRLGLTECRPLTPFDTLTVYLKEFLKKLILKKVSR